MTEKEEKELVKYEEALKELRLGRLTFLHLLTLLFIGLKLAVVGVVAIWSWWWVLSPFILLLIMRILAKWTIEAAVKKLEDKQ